MSGSLADSQRLLARLVTDGPLRARFASEPDVVAAEFGLSTAEARTLATISMSQLEDFARSLIRKRRGEVESLMPMTARALGPSRFVTEFRRHAEILVPAGIKKHRDDALGFADFAAREVLDPPWLGDLARFEAIAILAHDPSRRWTWLRLRYHPRNLAIASLDQPQKPKPTAILWYRLQARGQLRWLVLAWPGRGDSPGD